jgi:hypothetical protein
MKRSLIAILLVVIASLIVSSSVATIQAETQPKGSTLFARDALQRLSGLRNRDRHKTPDTQCPEKPR